MNAPQNLLFFPSQEHNCQIVEKLSGSNLNQKDSSLFHLKVDASKITQVSPVPKSCTSKPEIVSSLGPFTFSLGVPPVSHQVSALSQSNITVSKANEVVGSNNQAILSETAVSGAAASLRARLMKIRQKNQAVEPEVASEVASNIIRMKSHEDQLLHSPSSLDAESIHSYQSCMKIFSNIVSNNLVSENSPIVKSCISSLMKVHTAIAESESTADMALRKDIIDDVSNFVENLTCILAFAFNKGDSAENVGMCVPLLSIVIAALMAVFRDVEMAYSVSQSSLLSLIRTASHCLLDSRLAVAATHVSGLDESVSSQMVRGMNKVSLNYSTLYTPSRH
jgi:hypothetical protein